MPRGGSLRNSTNEELLLGDRVSGTIQIRCKHKIVSRHCVNGTWSPGIPDCNCIPLESAAVETACSSNGNDETTCSAVTMKCPSWYFNAEQSVTCDESGVWISVRPFNRCRHQCGKVLGWDVSVRLKATGATLCHAAVINSVYVITQKSCVAKYQPNDLFLWVEGLAYSFQSYEYGGRFVMLRTKTPIEFNENTMPICVDDMNVTDDGIYQWVLDADEACQPNIEGDLVKCHSNDTQCIYQFGTAFHVLSNERIDGEARGYLFGIGHAHTRDSTSVDGYYSCDLKSHDRFNRDDYEDADFLDYSPKRRG